MVSAEKHQLDFFDLNTLFSVVWDGKFLIALAAIGCGALFGVLTYLITPVYRVTSVVADASEQGGSQALLSSLGQLGSLANLAGVSVGGEVRPSDEALAVLESVAFLGSFIEENDLMPVLFEDDWNPVSRTWNGSEDERPTLPKGVRLLRNLLAVERDRRTSLISISVEWKDPSLAARWCHALVEKVNYEMQQRALQRARGQIQYLRKQMDLETTLETRQAVGRLLEAQLKQEMLASVSREYAFRVVSRGLAPERDDYIRPKRKLMAALGIILGGSIGILIAFFRIQRRYS